MHPLKYADGPDPVFSSLSRRRRVTAAASYYSLPQFRGARGVCNATQSFDSTPRFAAIGFALVSKELNILLVLIRERMIWKDFSIFCYI